MKLFKDVEMPKPPYPHLDSPLLLHPRNVDKLDSYEFSILKARVNAWLNNPASSNPNYAIDHATALALCYGAEGIFILAQVLQKKCELDRVDDEPYESSLIKAVMLYQVALSLSQGNESFNKEQIAAAIQACRQMQPSSITEENFDIEIRDLLSVYLPESMRKENN